jgi:aspartyl-tRNA(Asn)/glutamyl-tRNA(Gln) amidotransferase subunit C
MSLTFEQVQHIANLSRLELTDEEIACYREQLSAILAYFQRLEGIDTGDIRPAAGGGNLQSELRADQPYPGLELQDLLRNAPDIDENQFRIPPVFE